MHIFSWLTARTKANPSQVADSAESLLPTFATLRPENPDQNRRLVQLVEAVNKTGGSYHRLDFGSGLVTNGDYNMAKYVQFYHLPNNLQGKAVLDIGTASGYFALECARRGGRVTAIDIYDDCLLSDLLAVLNVDVRYVKKSIYDLDTSFGQFDLVVCGSVLLHLPDPLGAIHRMRNVCRGQTIVSTACPPDSMNNPRPICEFTGEKAADGNYWSYWTIGAAALRKMLLISGFSRVENEHHFTLTSEMGRTVFATPHVAMTGIV